MPEQVLAHIGQVLTEHVFHARLPQYIAKLAAHPDRQNREPSLNQQAKLACDTIVGLAHQTLTAVAQTPAARSATADVSGGPEPVTYGEQCFASPEKSGEVGAVDTFAAVAWYDPKSGRVLHRVELSFISDVVVLFGAEAFLETSQVLGEVEAEPDAAFRELLADSVNNGASSQVDAEGRPFQYQVQPSSLEIELSIIGEADGSIDQVILAIRRGGAQLYRFSLYACEGGGHSPWVDFAEPADGPGDGAVQTIEELVVDALDEGASRPKITVVNDDFRLTAQTVLSVHETAKLLVDCWIDCSKDLPSGPGELQD
jgi:hypothetical protein